MSLSQRAAEAEGTRAAPSFRALSEAETAAILGGQLLAALAANDSVLRHVVQPRPGQELDAS